MVGVMMSMSESWRFIVYL